MAFNNANGSHGFCYFLTVAEKGVHTHPWIRSWQPWFRIKWLWWSRGNTCLECSRTVTVVGHLGSRKFALRLAKLQFWQPMIGCPIEVDFNNSKSVLFFNRGRICFEIRRKQGKWPTTVLTSCPVNQTAPPARLGLLSPFQVVCLPLVGAKQTNKSFVAVVQACSVCPSVLWCNRWRVYCQQPWQWRHLACLWFAAVLVFQRRWPSGCMVCLQRALWRTPLSSIMGPVPVLRHRPPASSNPLFIFSSLYAQQNGALHRGVSQLLDGVPA